MSTISQLYANPVQLLTGAQLAGLANAAAFASAPIALSGLTPFPTNLYLGQEAGWKTASGTLGSNPVVRIWAAGSIDGTNFGGSYGTHTLGGAAGAFTMPANAGNLILLQQSPINGSAQVELMQPYDALLDFGYLPKSIVLIVENQTGLALDATTPGDLWYSPDNLQF